VCESEGGEARSVKREAWKRSSVPSVAGSKSSRSYPQLFLGRKVPGKASSSPTQSSDNKP